MTVGGSSTDHDVRAGFSAPRARSAEWAVLPIWKMIVGVWSLAAETLEVFYKNVSAVCQDETVNAT